MEARRNKQMDTLKSMEPQDREKLLSTAPALWLGEIIQMNQQARYNNSLDAIALVSDLYKLNGSMASSDIAASR